ncbi:TPA: TIM barrel protein [Escherichia coli]|nr:TIM barrel protein [Escherichia coli]
MSDFAKVEQSLREEMTRIASSFFQRGYATGSAGNLSLLLPDGNLLATPTGSCLGNLDPQRLSKVTADGEWLSGDNPSKEVLFHLALYRNNPLCKAVVHLHSTWSTALSCLEGLDSKALAIVEEVARDNVFIQLDTFHAQKVDGNLTHLIRNYAGKYAHVQIAGLPDRHEPDDGEINYPWLFRLFDEVGYQGWIGCEYKPRGLTKEGLGWFDAWR